MRLVVLIAKIKIVVIILPEDKVSRFNPNVGK